MSREPQADPAAVDAVLIASRSMVAIATMPLAAATEETTIAQYRVLAALAAGGPQRLVDLAGTLGVMPPAAGRMCDRLAGKGLVRRRRARGDRRSVVVSVTPAGRHVVDEAAKQRRAVIADVLARLSAPAQQAVAEALRAFAEAAGEVPGSQWSGAVPEARVPADRVPADRVPAARVPAARVSAPRPRQPLQPVQPSRSAADSVKERP